MNLLHMNWSLVITCIIRANTLLPGGKIAQMYSLMHSLVTKKRYFVAEKVVIGKIENMDNYIVISKELVKLNIKLKLCSMHTRLPGVC